MAIINPYINFNGNTEEAFNFYKSVFGGEFTLISRFGDMPHQMPISEEDAKKIMHISLPIGKGNVLMGTDFLESMGHKMIEGNRYSLSVSAQSRDEASELFKGLSTDGKVEMPIADSPWGSYFGMLSDKFGIQWMVDYDPNYNQ